MSDVSFALEAKSDQLNAIDIMGYEPVITIRDVKVLKGEQPVSVFYHGDNNRPWKPCKGMLRILAAAWGRDSKLWIGKSLQIYCDEKVRYAGKEVGGVRIRAMSDIHSNGMNFMITLNRQQRVPYPVGFLSMDRPPYPEDKFKKGLPKMVEMLQSGEMTVGQIVAQCQKTGDLSSEQIAELEKNSPVLVDGDDEFNGFEGE